MFELAQTKIVIKISKRDQQTQTLYLLYRLKALDKSPKWLADADAPRAIGVKDVKQTEDPAEGILKNELNKKVQKY